MQQGKPQSVACNHSNDVMVDTRVCHFERLASKKSIISLCQTFIDVEETSLHSTSLL